MDFAARQTNLKEAEICLLYKYRYEDFIPGIECTEARHTIKLWDFLNQGEHEYAFEWEFSEQYEDVLKILLTVRLSDAHGRKGRKKEVENHQRGLDFDFEAS